MQNWTCKAGKDIFKCSCLNQRPRNILLSKRFVADCIEKQKMGENSEQQTILLRPLPWLITKGESSAFEKWSTLTFSQFWRWWQQQARFLLLCRLAPLLARLQGGTSVTTEVWLGWIATAHALRVEIACLLQLIFAMVDRQINRLVNGWGDAAPAHRCSD